MSGSRAERLRRLHQVQTRKRQLEEWRLAELVRQGEALDAEIVEILASLGDQSLLHGLFLEAKAATLRRKDVERTANRAEIAAARAGLQEATGIEKRLEKVSGEALAGERQIEEQRELAQTLETFLTVRDAARASLE